MPYRVLHYEYADKTDIPIATPRVAQSLIPVSISSPYILGVGQVGQALTVYPGAWLNSPTFTYQWFRGNLSTSITSPSASPLYIPVVADIANILYVGVTATNVYGSVTTYSTSSPYGTFQTMLPGGAPTFIYSFPGTPAQEVNHLHQAPGGQYIGMTTYTLSPFNESISYLGTAILLLNTATGVVNTVVPANPSFSNANTNWWYDGQSFLYSSSNMVGGANPTKHGARRYFPATGNDVIFYNPNISIADFSVNHIGAVVFGGQTVINGFQTSALYIYYGGILTQITTPNVQASFNPSGDVDPQWSPSGNYISCSRSISPGLFTIVVINVSGPPSWVNISETIITPPGSAAAFDGVAPWSDNDQYLVTWYTDPANRAANGIYYMNKDGSGRTRINLQAQVQFNDPSFVSGSGSMSPTILYSTGFVQPIFGALPVNTVLPMITGGAVVGNTLVGHAGTWLNGATFTYQWARGGTPVPGATTLSGYLLTSADAGFSITLIETATSTSSAGYVSATSAPTSPVNGDALNLSIHITTDSMPIAA